MKTSIKILSLFFICAYLPSCGISKYTAPPFTDMDKIMNLETGATIEEVSTALKVDPYDIVYSHDKSKILLIYNYRVRDRRLGLPTKNAEQIIHSEEAQREGEKWYNLNYKELFALFEEGKLKSIYGEEVLSSASSILSIEDYLDGGELIIGEGNSNVSSGRSDLLLASSLYHDRFNRKNTELAEDEIAKKRRNVLLIGGGVLLTLINLIL